MAAVPLEFWALAHVSLRCSRLGRWLCQNTVRWCFCRYKGIFSEQFGCLQEADLSIQHQASVSTAQCYSTEKTAATVLNILTTCRQAPTSHHVSLFSCGKDPDDLNGKNKAVQTRPVWLTN